MGLRQLFSNENGKVSTTTTIQFIGSIGAIGVLIYCTYLDRPYVLSMFDSVLLYLVSSTTARGVVSTVRERNQLNSSKRAKKKEGEE